MRTTLDIDDDVWAAAKEIARRQGTPAGRVVSTLLRRALTGPGPSSDVHLPTGPVTAGGFRPFPSQGTPITNDLIDSLRDAEGV